MGRRRKKGRPVNGWIVLDKDYDFGSTDAVSKLKWLFKAQKAGHAGTLDPLATGVLPIAFGEATKTVPYVTDARKTYRFTARWGVSTTTDDAEGEALATTDARPGAGAVEAALAEFIGDIEQSPPKFSAVKIDGARAYDLAREGLAVSPESRIITIHDLRVIDTPDCDHTTFEAVTGKGAYVRALVRDLAIKLGTEGHVSALRRTAVGPFAEADAVRIRDLEDAETPEHLDEALLPLEAALAHLPQAQIGGAEAGRLRCGQPAILSPATARGVRAGEAGAVPSVFATSDGAPVAICELDGLKLHPLRVFNLSEQG